MPLAYFAQIAVLARQAGSDFAQPQYIGDPRAAGSSLHWTRGARLPEDTGGQELYEAPSAPGAASSASGSGRPPGR